MVFGRMVVSHSLPRIQVVHAIAGNDGHDMSDVVSTIDVKSVYTFFKLFL